jgi:hypothetical protein
MGKTWRLDTETKGTGAHVAPLERVESAPESDRGLATVTLERPPRAAKPVEPAGPRTFKVLDIRSSQVLAEGIDTQATVELLRSVNSVVDVRVYARVPQTGRWRLLGLGEQRALWGFRDKTEAS